MTALVIGLAVVVALLTVLVVGLLRTNAEVLRALHDRGINLDEATPVGFTPPPTGPDGAPLGASLGVPAADVVGTTPYGDALAVGVGATGAVTLLAFLSSGCLSCAGIWRELASGAGDALPRGTRVVAVTRDASEESPSEIARLAPESVTTVLSTQAWDDYRVPGSPYFVLVDAAAGVVGEGTASSWAQVTRLLRQAADDRGITLGAQPRRPRRGADRAAHADEELRAAGIEPGDPSLYPGTPTEEP